MKRSWTSLVAFRTFGPRHQGAGGIVVMMYPGDCPGHVATRLRNLMRKMLENPFAAQKSPFVGHGDCSRRRVQHKEDSHNHSRWPHSGTREPCVTKRGITLYHWTATAQCCCSARSGSLAAPRHVLLSAGIV